jgi:Asp-tRNA(Asn)/Glu-tRNA(Gln) amidotransferase A subunit family amidase
MQGYVADYSSFLTEQIERAGLNIIGRTTCPEYGVTGTTESLLTGATTNPWDTGKIAGGSSGGSAAITAAGVVPMCHSNDGGGSTRIPASICGNAGMKHSRGRISYSPEGCDLSFPLFSDGVNTHSVRDMAGFLDAVMGPAPGEPVPWAKPDRPYVEEVDRDPGKFRVAMCSEQWGPIPIDKHITGEIQQVAKLLESAGHSVEEAVPAIDYEAYLNVFRQIWVIDISAMLDYEAELMGREVSADTVEPMTLKMYEAGKGATAAERLGISGFMSVISRQLGAFYEDYDLLLTPVLVDDTPPLGSPFNLVQEGQTLDDWFENAFHLIPITPLNNFTGTPAVSLPLCEDSTGMPLGAHIMAPIGREDRLFNVAGQIEKIAPWAGKKPPLHVTSA